MESKTSTASNSDKTKSGKPNKSSKKNKDHEYRDSVVTSAYESSLPGIMQADFMKNLNPLADIGEYTNTICKNNA